MIESLTTLNGSKATAERGEAKVEAIMFDPRLPAELLCASYRASIGVTVVSFRLPKLGPCWIFIPDYAAPMANSALRLLAAYRGTLH